MAGVKIIQDLAILLLTAGALGWAFQKYGFPSIVGYLLAGIILSPTGLLESFNPSLSFIPDKHYIEILSQLGLVLIMFSLGSGLSPQRLRQLGAGLVVATLLSIALIFNGMKFVGSFFDIEAGASLFLAATLIVSSSTVITKLLQRMGATHEKSSRLAQNITVIEDVVTVILLTLLGSLTHLGLLESVEALGIIGGFIILMAICALFIVPRFLTSLNRTARPETQAVLMVGLLCALAWICMRAGYSLALGAILLGAVVAGTKYYNQLERILGGTRDVFTAIFFAAMGMLFNFKTLIQVWPVILLFSTFVLVGRPMVYSIILMLTGKRSYEAIRASIILTPIGEFSFLITLIGVQAYVLSPAYYTIVVGVALATTFLGTFLIRDSEKILAISDRLTPSFFKDWLVFYHTWIHRVTRQGQSSLLWQLSSGRLLQVTVQFFFITGMMVFYSAFHTKIKQWTGSEVWSHHNLDLIFGLIFGAILLIPIVGLWRNISALALLYSHATTKGFKRREQWQPLIELILKTLAAIPLILWLLTLMPFDLSWGKILAILGGSLGLLLILFRRKIILWHSTLEYELAQTIVEHKTHEGSHKWLQSHGVWNLTLKEVSIPDHADCSGMTLEAIQLPSKFGCSIVSIDRQGFIIGNPHAQTSVYPGDNLLLLGTNEQIDPAENFLTKSTREEKDISHSFRDMIMETTIIEHDSIVVGKKLSELALPKQYGVLITAIKRGDQRIVNPTANEILQAGDELLLLGIPSQIQQLQQKWSAATP